MFWSIQQKMKYSAKMWCYTITGHLESYHNSFIRAMQWIMVTIKQIGPNQQTQWMEWIDMSGSGDPLITTKK